MEPKVEEFTVCKVSELETSVQHPKVCYFAHKHDHAVDSLSEVGRRVEKGGAKEEVVKEGGWREGRGGRGRGKSESEDVSLNNH